MRKLIIVFTLIYISNMNIYSQEEDSIIYIFPDKVEQRLFEQIKKVDSINNIYFEFYLQTIDENRFRLTYSYSKKKSNNYWVKNTNRFILINKKKYPLILDYDTIFSTYKPNKIGEYGHRDGTIMKHLIIYEGYNITFNKNGECLQEDFGIYQKTN